MDKEQLVAHLRDGALVITPNNRLSNQWLLDFYQAPEVRQPPEKPRCWPYATFVRTLFHQTRHRYAHTHHPMLISSLQQRHLWQQILSKQTDYPCNEGLVHDVNEAWERCQHWAIAADDEAFSQTPQTLQFQQWRDEFEQALEARHLITDAQLVPYLLTFPDVLPKTRVIWACFDDYTPVQCALQQALEATDCQQTYYDLEPTLTKAQLYPANDQHDELLQLIAWLRVRLEAGDQRIGVVVPDLQTRAIPLQRLLQRYLPAHPFDISLGKSLLDYPLIAHALQWLAWDTQTITHHQLRLLLHSPYLTGSQTEFVLRSQAIEDSPLLREARIPMTVAVRELRIKTPILATLIEQLTHYPEHASPKGWIEQFKARLTAFGFPGEYSLNSSSYQCAQRFMTLLDDYLEFTLISPVMNKQQALYALQEAARATIFQIQKPTMPIQILGLLEASGCTFDSVWMMGLTDQCLPQKTNPSAFIPLALQREHAMPHALASRELQLALQAVQRLTRASPHCVFSYPRFSGDMPNLASPLLAGLALFTPNTQTHAHVPTALIRYEDTYTLALMPQEAITGGTTLLANQAACPFRAFAAHRLHAKRDAEPSTGPDASERGQTVHRVMELIWRELRSQEQLRTTPSDVLDGCIERAIRQALAPIVRARSLSFQPLIQAVELSRIKRLVYACLQWELQRPNFVIEALEQTFTLPLGGIDFRVRIDRLDALVASDAHHESSPAKWVIDYKSSIPTQKPWFEERPDAPQLLLYALLDETINTLLFVQLKAGRLQCSGLSEHAIPMKGITTLKKEEHWSDYQERWHHQLTALAQEFRMGIGTPQPSRSNTCLSCEFQNLCRFD